MSEKDRLGCARLFGIGCFSCLGLVLLTLAGIWVSWDSIRESGWFRSFGQTVATAKSEAAQLATLRAALLELYPAREIQIQVGVESKSQRTTKTLSVGFVDPQFQLPDGASERETAARAVAGAIATRYPTLGHYDRLFLTFSNRGDGGTTFASEFKYHFEIAELLGTAKPLP